MQQSSKDQSAIGGLNSKVPKTLAGPGSYESECLKARNAVSTVAAGHLSALEERCSNLPAASPTDGTCQRRQAGHVVSDNPCTPPVETQHQFIRRW